MKKNLELEKIIKDCMDGTVRIEERKPMTIRVWKRGIFGNGLTLVLMTFKTFHPKKEDFATLFLAATAYLFLSANTPRLISSEYLSSLHLLYDTGTDPDVLDWV